MDRFSKQQLLFSLSSDPQAAVTALPEMHARWPRVQVCSLSGVPPPCFSLNSDVVPLPWFPVALGYPASGVWSTLPSDTYQIKDPTWLAIQHECTGHVKGEEAAVQRQILGYKLLEAFENF